MNIQPIGERILVQQVKKQEKTAGGIFIPTDAQEEKKQAIVKAVGIFKDGRALPVNVGDTVLYGGYSSEDFEFNGEKYLLIEFKDILAKIGGHNE